MGEVQHFRWDLKKLTEMEKEKLSLSSLVARGDVGVGGGLRGGQRRGGEAVFGLDIHLQIFYSSFFLLRVSGCAL